MVLTIKPASLSQIRRSNQVILSHCFRRFRAGTKLVCCRRFGGDFEAIWRRDSFSLAIWRRDDVSYCINRSTHSWHPASNGVVITTEKKLPSVLVDETSYDTFDIGFLTTDDFTNADILEAMNPTVVKRLHSDWIGSFAIPLITGFLGKVWKPCAVTTLGRGGSDLTGTTIGKGLGLRQIQVWKDVDGVLTCDLSIHSREEPVPYLTFEEDCI